MYIYVIVYNVRVYSAYKSINLAYVCSTWQMILYSVSLRSIDAITPIALHVFSIYRENEVVRYKKTWNESIHLDQGELSNISVYENYRQINITC